MPDWCGGKRPTVLTRSLVRRLEARPRPVPRDAVRVTVGRLPVVVPAERRPVLPHTRRCGPDAGVHDRLRAHGSRPTRAGVGGACVDDVKADPGVPEGTKGGFPPTTTRTDLGRSGSAGGEGRTVGGRGHLELEMSQSQTSLV